MLFVESDSEMILEDNPTRGFIIDDVIRADETKCPYEKYFQCKYNFKSNLLLERHINNCHPEKYTEVNKNIRRCYENGPFIFHVLKWAISTSRVLGHFDELYEGSPKWPKTAV